MLVLMNGVCRYKYNLTRGKGIFVLSEADDKPSEAVDKPSEAVDKPLCLWQ